MAMAGAELLLYPTAIGWHPPDDDDEKARQKDAWTLIQRSHAVANGLPVIVANRVGHEADLSGIGQASTSGAVASSAAPRVKCWPTVANRPNACW